MGIAHAFVSAKADPADTTLIKPSNWNDKHSIDEIDYSATIPLTAGVKNFNLWTLTAAPDGLSGDIRSFYLDARTRPVAHFTSFATGAFISATHDQGDFNFTTAGLRALVSQSVQSVAATSVNEARGMEALYRCTAGTIVQGIGLLVARGFAGDGGTVENGIGIKIFPHAAPTPTGLDIAIWSQGGEHRFVGSVKIGADASPSFPLDVVGVTLIRQQDTENGLWVQRGTDTAPSNLGALIRAANNASTKTYFKIDAAVAGAGETPMWLSIADADAIRVVVGANGSGGTGLRALCVADA